MRVAILGVGGVGRTLASELRSDERVESLLLIDKIGERATVLAGIRGRVAMEAKQLDVGQQDALSRAVRKCDVVVNAALPRYNLTAMRAAIDAGADYLDVAAAGPETPGGPPGILVQLELHEAFRSAGRRAIVSMGLDPGMSNVIARESADKLDTIDAIRIRSGGIVKLAGFQTFPLYSREAFLADILVRPTIWLDGALVDREPMSEAEDYAFPDPVGVQRTFLMSHEEVKTLPRYLGKPVGRVDFKYALDSHLVHALLSLDALGMLRESKMIRVGNQTVSFRRALLAAFPEPSALVTPLEGTKVVSAEVEGTRGGERTILRSDIVLTHIEANRRRGTTAVYYLTAVAAAIGVGMLGEKALPGPGVYPAEALDPAKVLEAWTARDLTVSRSERQVAA